jgi:signal transduction histidine kinase/ligand-binding sensor domain-containing protein
MALASRCARKCAASILAAALSLVCGTGALALGRSTSFADLHHTAWRGDDGAPANIVAMAQTPDGFLWLGTGGGLFRFDGVRFELVNTSNGAELPTGSISALLATPAGQLFIGHRFNGGVSILDQRGIEHHRSPKELFNAWAFAVDPQGAVWGAFTGGVARFQGGTWQPFELDGEPIVSRSVLVDQEGSVWVTARTGAFVLPQGASAFQRVEADLPSSPLLAQARDGRVWAVDVVRQRITALARDGTRFGASLDRASMPMPATGDRHWFDSYGATWIRTGEGLVRMAGSRPIVRTFGAPQGLTGAVLCLLEDREGNVWVGTAGGLDRFRPRDARQVELGRNLGSVAVAAADRGRVWATTELGGLVRVGDAVEPFLPIGERATHVHRDREAVIWVGTRDKLWRIDQSDRPVQVPRPDAAELGEGVADRPVQAVGKDRSGALWLSTVVRGTFRRLDDAWVRVPDPLGALVSAIGNDGDGRLWVGYLEGGAARVDGDEVLAFAPENGMSIGPVLSIFGRGPRVWFGGQQGVALFDGSTMKTLSFGGLEKVEYASGIVETASGQLWINAANGLTLVEAAEWQRALANPAHRVAHRRFDAHDGLYGAPTMIRPLPTLVEAGDGRLWATTSAGLFVIDPGQLRRNALAPPVIVKGLFAGDRRYAPDNGRLQDAGTADLRIEYTATSLTIPQRVRFRYKLEGYDKDWQDVGSRREAVYTQVGPGDYVFRVVAANNDGVWNETGAAMAITVPPQFWQTRWFGALLLACAGAVLWLLYRLRIRQVSAQLRGRMAARLQERERIARELHDTLLQGITGLTLHVRAAANQVPAASALRGRLELALARANEVMVEGRDRVSELRVREELRSSLAAVLTDMGRELSDLYPGPRCEVSVIGEEREINALVGEQADRIAREALTNALRHADSRVIELRLCFDPDALRLTVSDDGRGFEADVPAACGPSGHFGLAGMRERAKQVGGELSVKTGPQGTRVDFVVAAAAAYCPRRS